MAEGSQQELDVADELMKSMTRLRARLRSESWQNEMPWTWSQLTTLSRIVETEPTTTTELAQGEHVRRQSMAETVAALRADDLVTASPDPVDGRKSLITSTFKGRRLLERIPAARQAWLGDAIGTLLDPEERAVLLRATALMRRLADS